MSAVAWLAPAVSSLPVDQPSTTFEPTAADSFALNVTTDPSVAEPAWADTVTPSSPTIVPTALAVEMVTPPGRVVPVMVTLKVSSPSVVVSPVVDTEKLASVWPAVIVRLAPVTAV